MTTMHTPGPWECTNHIDEEHFADIESINGPLYIRAEFMPTYGHVKKSVLALRDAEMLANARLIAAAPELLAAVEAFLKYDAEDHDGGMEMMLNYADALDKCKSAHAKATAP